MIIATSERDVDPATGAPACLVQEGGVQRTLSTGSHAYNWVYKMDLNTAKNRFYGRYHLQLLQFLQR